jgi:hypothetical protein
MANVGGMIDKDAVIQRFIDRVITPAINSVEVEDNDVDIPNPLNFPTGAILKQDHAITPKDFPEINPSGGLITASDLAALFQIYAFQLTAITRATYSRYKTDGNIHDQEVIFTAKITSLSSNYRLYRPTFNARLEAAPNPLTNLQPGRPASIAALDALIDRLANILTQVRTSDPPREILICHSSINMVTPPVVVHNHRSRGRR